MPVDKDKLNALLRDMPQVDAVLMRSELKATLDEYRHDVVTRLVREALAKARKDIVAGKRAIPPDATVVAAEVAARLDALSKPLIYPAVNACGILLHTNLGRALLTSRASDVVARIANRYCNLEVDLATGKRTRRDVTLEPLLQALTGCQAATVVNNTSAAVFLFLHALAAGREVVTSRGELVEIGGSFRVPDVVAASGCRLIEVGTTNRTRLADYENAITDNTALILKTHTSNYRVVGFTESVGVADLSKLGKRRGIPVAVDIGSGYIAPDNNALLPEMEVLETLDADPELVCFSGDKLLGGPQAGIILGETKYIDMLRTNALWRVLRIDKLTVAALGATLVEHLKHSADDAAGFTQRNHLAHTPGALRELADALAKELRAVQPGWQIEVVEADGFFGGGTMPEESIPSFAVTIEPTTLSADELDHTLRNDSPAVVGYMIGGVFALNMLALLPGDDERILTRIAGITG